MEPQHLVLIAPSELVEQVIAGWHRILPEDGILYHTTIVKAAWKGATMATFQADHPEYIEGLVEVIAREIPDAVTCLMTRF